MAEYDGKAALQQAKQGLVALECALENLIWIENNTETPDIEKHRQRVGKCFGKLQDYVDTLEEQINAPAR